MRRIGFLVNPYAGMGGAVGLKGTDGEVNEAIRRGAVPRAAGRATEALRALHDPDLFFVTCSGPMGEDALSGAGLTNFSVEYRCRDTTTAADTKRACARFLELGVFLILFCGGDGTARDILDVVGNRVPVLGIPAGVKMYSGVFAVNPAAVAEILSRSGEVQMRDAEVMDVDEAAYRRGELKTTLYGYARTPYIPERVAMPKQVFEQQDEKRAKEEIAQFIAEVIEGTPETVTILGPGTTTAKIGEVLGIKKTLLGFDAVKGHVPIGYDLDEHALLLLLPSGASARLVISPIGSQGFVLGRGTQQVSPVVIRKIGTRNIVVVATPFKLRHTPALYVDTGDPALDREFGDYINVVSGYRIAQRKRLVHP